MNKNKIRIYELSRELKLDNKELIAICNQINIAVKSHNSTITESEVELIRTATQKQTKNGVASSQAKSLKRTIKAEDWGYVFVGSTVDSFIRHLEGDVGIEAYPDFAERREHANKLMFECVGQKACLFYVRRKGPGKDAKDEIWELTIATDREDVQLPARLKKLGKTLSLLAAVAPDGNGGLKLLSAKLLQPVRGHADGYAASFYLRLLPNHRHHIDIPSTALRRMATKPVCGDHLPTEEHLKVWKAFLQIEENIAKTRQFCVPFLNYNYILGKRRITFEVDVAAATLDGSVENSLEYENFWERVQRARNEDIKLFETAPTAKNWRNSRQLGSIEDFDPRRRLIHIRLERELAEYLTVERYQPPVTGFLFFEAAGDIQQIRRKKEALEQLKQGYTQNPYLGNFLFDASQARPIQKTVQLLPNDLLLSSANPGQKAAVETVLAAKDLVLIQGPPGTGKTTVIAEICYQVALRGGRTLITSQANLAVDNALSRLVHNPVIRAIRKGRSEKVGEEGQPFLEEHVIGTWLENTANDCEKNLSKRQQNVETLRQLLTYLPRFNAYLKLEEEYQQQQTQLKKNQAQLEITCREQETLYKVSLAQTNEIKSLLSGLENLLSAAPNINWESPEVVNFLPRLKPYTKDKVVVENFVANVSKAVKEATKLGFARPACGAFGLAVWLRETVTTGLSESKTAFIYAEDAMNSMSEVAVLMQDFKQKSTALTQLQSNYHQFVNKQQSLNQTIQTWDNHKQKVDFIITAVQEWKSTATSRLYQILNNCRQTGHFLTDAALQLPLALVDLAQSSNLELVPEIYKVNKIDYLPDWVKLNKALSFEVEGGFSNLQGKQYKFGHFLHISFKQTPLVLSISDRLQWQEMGKKFNQYPQLDRNQRQTLVKNTQHFLGTIEQVYGLSWAPNHIDSTLQNIAQDLLESILTNARNCVLPVKKQTEQQLQHLHTQFNELQKTGINQKQISTAQDQLEKVRKEVDLKLTRVIHLLQKLNQQTNLPDKLRTLAEQYLANQSYIWESPQQFSTIVHSWKNPNQEIENLISSLEPFSVLEFIRSCLIEHLSQVEQENENALRQFQETQTKLREVEHNSQPQPSAELINERNWCQQVWQEIPEKFKPDIPVTDLFSLEFLQQIKTQFESWQREQEQEETYLNRYQDFVQDWISKLRNPSEGDRHDLRQVYLDNANVVGITCVQAANREFSEEFKSFDVVIIDEVSKCTPPELLIPALKGKKLVMVGDHRQLPPMLNTSTIEEVAQEIGNTREELRFVEESLFKTQFETAHESIKQMLTTQYRMHPTIMGAINQFYDGKLECGIAQPEIKRAHHLAGEIIHNHHHLLWIKTPIENEFQEQREGTSFFNIREIDIIELLCQQIESAWASRVINGEPKKEIAVITFYGAQLRKIDERLKSELFPSLQIRTGTVDRFQGMERPIVIVSMVRNNSNRDVGFAKKPERVNVAFSRAQELLVIVGCHDLFTQQTGKTGSMYLEVSNIVRHHGGVVDASSF
jgi:KaiC/GvpD/RAD55 family RecA-like ATPase